MSASDLLNRGPEVIGIGLQRFVDDLQSQGIAASSVDWRPPATSDPAVLQAIATLSSGATAELVDKANEEALNRMLSADPILVNVNLAAQLIDGLGEHKILHAGPPIDWKDMCLSLIHI